MSVAIAVRQGTDEWLEARRSLITARLAALSDRSGGPDACWPFTGFKRDGYGRIAIGNQRAGQAHRVAYELAIGPIPAGLQLDHLCRNRACVNPAHLEAVTQTENVRRGIGGWNMRIKTHCKVGHPYDEANTYRHNGRRHCRACRRETARRLAA